MKVTELRATEAPAPLGYKDYKMEANNHFNYVTHSSVAANSGLKLSSGDSLYTNGSSMSFPQQGKNLNGEMNVNGITTVIGPSVPGPHPPTAPYPHMSDHHQGSAGYDYPWGTQSQYSPAMASSPGHGMHQKQPSPGGMQQQNQHHFQGHGQYQLNGGMPGSHQPPVAAPPNVTLTGGQYWNRANPGQQPLGYNSHSMYGAYQSQVHPGIVPSQQHLHQQQPPPQPPAHQQTPQHLHSHLHPHHQQRQQHSQQYAMVPNGMPYYQPQHPPLPATPPQSQAQMMPPTSQNFTPPRGSPQHQHMGRAGTDSPLPAGVSSVPVMSPSKVADSGSPQSQARERSPHGGSVGMPAVMQGRMSEAFKELDIGYNGMERASVAQRLLKSDSYPQKPSGSPMVPTGDYFQHSELPMAPHNEMASSAKESVPPPHSIPSPPPAVSAPSSVVSTPPRVSAPSVGSKPPMGASGSSVISSSVTSTPPRNSASPMSAAPSPPVVGPPPPVVGPPPPVVGPPPPVVGPPPRLSSPPLMVQGLRPSVTTSHSVFTVSPASVSAPSSKPLVSPLLDTSSRPPAVSVPHPGSTSTSKSMARQSTPATSAPPATVSNPTMGSAPTHSMSTPISVLQHMVQGSRPPPLTSSSPALPGVPKEQFWTPSVSEAAPPPTVSGSPPVVSAASVVTRAPSAVSAPSVLVSSPSLLVSTLPQPVVPALSTESESAVSSPKKVAMPVTVNVESHALQQPPLLFPRSPGKHSGSPLLKLRSVETPMAAKPKKVRVKKAKPLEPKPPKKAKMDTDTKPNDDDHNDGDDSSTAGDTPRRRVATGEQVHFPLLHGWRREIRVKKTEDRLKGETWYYSPCGRRMKQFPEVIKYLNRHQDTVVTREHFSFSPRMPVGDFYEERDTAEGVKWCLLANEEVPSVIMAITGRRGRPPNPDKEKPRPRVRRTKGSPVRKPGRPPKPKMVDLLSKVDARILKRLEAKEALTEEDKEKLVKIKKKMKRKARMKRMEDNKNKLIRQAKKQAKFDKSKETQDQEDVKTEQADQEPLLPALPQPALPEPKKRGPRKKKVEAPPAVVETDQERVAQGKRVLGARSKAKALAKAQAEAEAAVQASLVAKKQAERRAQAQRRLEERRRQQMVMEELKKPTEDMCLTDHRPLPELSRIPGVVLSGVAFSHCLAVVEFLHSYGKVIGLSVPRDVPSLGTLQEGLLGLGDSQSEIQDLLIKLVEAVLHDPGLPPYYQSVKILGEKLADVELTRSTVSEGLRIFLDSHGFDMEVCNVLRTKTFHALSPDTKAAILAFLVEELNGSNIVISEIDNTLENMATYRKNKWIIEGKLRRLKAALGRRTGRSEEELCLEERRRSSRVADEDNLSLEEEGHTERGSRRCTPKEEPKLSDTDSPTNASIPELERQIDRLTKRQVFFRKKLLQSSHSLRAVSLGQDRFRRRYWVLPHLGGVLVEGPEEILASEDILVKEVPITLLKREPKVEETPTPLTAPVLSPLPSQSETASPTEEDPLPGTASLMSSPRARGRPRKIKPEVELHLRTAKCRRRRRSNKSVGEWSSPGSKTSNGMQDLTQSAFHNWLSRSQGAVSEGAEPAAAGGLEGSQPDDSVKEMAEKHGQWFNLLPKQPCDDTSLTEPQTPPGTPPKRLTLTPSSLPALAAPLLQSVPASSDPPAQVTPTVSPVPAKPVRRRRRGSSPARRIGGRGAAARRRGRPPTMLFQEIEQQYFTQLVVKPIPASMVRGWWWIKEPEELTATLQALHPRGIREKVLHKHLAKHMEYLAEVCTRPINDPIFQVMVKAGEALLESIEQPWQVQERALETDVSALRWVEDLEQRVIVADLHLKMAPQNGRSDSDNSTETADAGFQPYTVPEADSTRDDLQYYEHDANPRDDWIVRTKKEWSDLPRVATHPLDLAVLRLANLERNIDRRYLKEPLWNLTEVVRLAPLTPEESQMGQMDVMSLESEITPRLRTWRQALDRCRSAPQLCLCLLQLEKAIAWERSLVKVTCQVCRKGDNDAYLLLCDGCDRGCHMYCLRPKVTQVPEGDWFCSTCVSKSSDGQSPRGSLCSSKQRARVKKRRYEDDSSDEETAPGRRSGTRHKDAGPTSSSSSSRYSGDWGGTTGLSPAKRRRMTTRNQPDLTYCEIILMEMESHPDAWPFQEPVNPRMVPGYRRIIKNPMDFLTMRERLLQGGYCSCEEFAADAHLVFSNCELFNEDTSEVGVAGHSMKRFFENRWAEFYESKDK
ncbi:hypothetical protein DPEC_G00005490 [Dallia pectoralis]|uniref:Uncharacterized protein n=1 Tax=Dallia pectoralis TaxID=75939 RepID=A0ACC2HJS7_DALPE|nr:hypothetical protein DPEC_G00005490 [Dallia pectoralis]